MNQVIKTYLDDHSLSEDAIADFGIITSDDRISIPIKDSDGRILFYKHRMFNENGPKYLYDKGSVATLFVDRYPMKDRVFLVEGEIDAIALSSFLKTNSENDYSVISTTGGCLFWNEEWNNLFEGKSVCIIYDRDEAGAQGSYRVWSSLCDSGIDCTIGTIPFGGGKDVSDVIKDDKKDLGFFGITIPLFHIPRKENQTKKIERMRNLRSIMTTLDKMENFESAKHFPHLLKVFRKNLAEEIRSLSRTKKKAIIDRQYQNLRDIPISDFIDFERGVARCIFHPDTRPSMIYNDKDSKFPNTVKCFSCGKFGTVFDVVMALYHTNFKGAVEILNKKVI